MRFNGNRIPIGNENWNAMIVIPYNENMVLIVHLSFFMFMYNENSCLL